jgi:hypothetical protein
MIVLLFPDTGAGAQKFVTHLSPKRWALSASTVSKPNRKSQPWKFEGRRYKKGHAPNKNAAAAFSEQ